MFFKKEVVEEKDDIEKLVIRLDNSIYPEDKMDTLEEILIFSREDPITTGTYSLDSIITSMGDLRNIDLNIRILENIFTCANKNEFIDVMLKDKNSIEILLSNKEKNTKGIYRLLDTLSENINFRNSLVKSKNIGYLCLSFIEDLNEFDLLIKMLIYDDFKKEILFEGILELLIARSELRYDVRIFKILNLMLKDNHFNQNYFIETEWWRILKQKEKNDVFEILKSLVDNANNNNEYIKDKIYQHVKFDLPVKLKEYHFIHKMVLNNVHYMDMFIKLCKEFEKSEENMKEVKSENDSNKENHQPIITGGEGDTAIEKSNRDEFFLRNIMKFLDNSNVFKLRLCSQYEMNSFILLVSEILLYDRNFFDFLKNKEECTNPFDIFITSRISLILSVRDVIESLPLIKDRKEINFDTLIYVVFNYNKAQVEGISQFLKEFAYDTTSYEPLRLLCVLICCVHDIKLNINCECIKRHLFSLRKFIVHLDLTSEFFLIEDCVNILIDKINEIVYKLNEQKYQ